MLIRSTWTLCPTAPITLPRTYGLELVKDLHHRMDIPFEDVPLPPITYSGIMGQIVPSKDFLSFSPDEPYHLCLCGLQEPVAKAIATLDLSPTLDFLGATFQVLDRQDEITSYEALYQSLVANEPDPPHRFDLTFLTPTAFAQNHTYLPLPMPTLMFRSWLERWNHFAPIYLGGSELLHYLEAAIVLRYHRLQTRPFPIHNHRVSGFTGTTTLRVLSHTDPLLATVANLLVTYAQFCGTGIKTRLGMGQTSYHV